MKSFSTSVLKAHIWTLCSLLKIVNDHDTLRILNWTSTLCLSSYWYLSSADLEIFVHPIDKKNFTVRQIVITLVFMRITTRIRCWFNSANKLSLRHRFQNLSKNGDHELLKHFRCLKSYSDLHKTNYLHKSVCYISFTSTMSSEIWSVQSHRLVSYGSVRHVQNKIHRTRYVLTEVMWLSLSRMKTCPTTTVTREILWIAWSAFLHMNIIVSMDLFIYKICKFKY